MPDTDDPLISKDGIKQKVPSISGGTAISANDGEQQEKRTEWGGKLEFLLTMVSNAVGLGEECINQ